MRVLWIVNILMPKLAEYLNINKSTSGSWLENLSYELSKEVDLAIVCVHGKEFKTYNVDNIKYYCLPGNGKNMLFYTKKYEKLWKKIYEDFKPDIINIHGTEYSHGLSFLRAVTNKNVVISMQGLLSKIQYVDKGGLPLSKFIFNRTLKECLKFNGVIEMNILHRKNAKHEIEMIQRVDNFICNNFWDESAVLEHNRNAKISKIDYVLREDFYNAEKWDVNKCIRKRIFTNPGGTPLKGLHILFEAMAILKYYYDDIEVIVPGFKHDSSFKLIPNSTYSKIVAKQIKKLGLENNIKFIGKQDTSGMIDNMLKANAVVIPSAIEGTSLILREAMFLGVPCIASFRGGMGEYVDNNINGLLYDFNDYYVLAQKLRLIFENDDVATSLSKNAINKGVASASKDDNSKMYLKKYREMIGDYNG